MRFIIHATNVQNKTDGKFMCPSRLKRVHLWLYF